jgi:hypothetical protein
MRLVEHLKSKKMEDRQSLIARYRAILTAADSATPEQARELEGIIEKLGYDLERVAKDADAIAMRGKLQRTAAGEADAQKQMNIARQKHAAWCDEAERIIKETEAKTVQLLSDKHESERVFGACRNAHRKLIELESANRELFDINDADLKRREHEHVGHQPNMHLGPELE